MSTLLALMDGLESRGNVIIIGATNRPDALDPALRRPGRFDRELRFDLPDRAGRLQILQIHARRWPAAQRPPGTVLEDVAGRTAGFAGADLQLLCTEAALSALRRCVGAEGLRALTGARQGGAGPGAPIDGFLPGEGDPCLGVAAADFERALQTLKPASSRAGDSHRVAQPLPAHLEPLLGCEVRRLAKTLTRLFPRLSLSRARDGGGSVGCALPSKCAHAAFVGTPRPRLCLRDPGTCTRAADAVARAALSLLEQEVAPFSAVSLSLAELLAEPAAAPEEAIARAVARARAAAPSVLFLSHLEAWERTLGAAASALLCTLLDGLDDTVCVLATRAGDSDDHGTLQDRLFEGCEIEIQGSKKRSRCAFFRPVVRHLYDETSRQAADAPRAGNQAKPFQSDGEPQPLPGGDESTNDSLTVRRALRRALLHALRALDGAGHGSGKTQGLLHRVNVQPGLSVTCALSDLEQALESDAPAADPQWRTKLLAAAERHCGVKPVRSDLGPMLAGRASAEAGQSPEAGLGVSPQALRESPAPSGDAGSCSPRQDHCRTLERKLAKLGRSLHTQQLEVGGACVTGVEWLCNPWCMA